MTDLHAALAKVCATFDKYGIAHDDKPPPKKAVADVFHVLPSSEELVALYTSTLRSDIVFGWYTEDLTLYAVSTLLQRQEGYRWAVGKHDKLLPDWSADWVVIGHVMGADPIIAAPKEPGTPIYWAMHGAVSGSRCVRLRRLRWARRRWPRGWTFSVASTEARSPMQRPTTSPDRRRSKRSRRGWRRSWGLVQ